VLGSAAFAQFGAALIARFAPDESLLAELMREPLRTRDHAVLLARHDTPEVFARLASFAAETSLADTPILQALEKSAHVEAAHTTFAIIATLEAQPGQGPRVKRYAKLGKALAARFGVKPPKKAKAAARPCWPSASLRDPAEMWSRRAAWPGGTACLRMA
jgi:hypothetical protein